MNSFPWSDGIFGQAKGAAGAGFDFDEDNALWAARYKIQLTVWSAGVAGQDRVTLLEQELLSQPFTPASDSLLPRRARFVLHA